MVCNADEWLSDCVDVRAGEREREKERKGMRQRYVCLFRGGVLCLGESVNTFDGCVGDRVGADECANQRNGWAGGVHGEGGGTWCTRLWR